MKRLLIALAFLLPTAAWAQTAQPYSQPRSANEKNLPILQNLVDYIATQSANTVLAGPASGGAAAPTFRVPGATDLQAWGALYVTQVPNKFWCYDELLTLATVSNTCGILPRVISGAVFTMQTTGGTNRVGALQMAVTNNTDVGAIAHSAVNSNVAFGGATWDFYISMKVSAVSDGTDTYFLHMGFLEEVTNDTAANRDAIKFRYSSGLNGGKWAGVVQANAVEVTCDTGVTPDTSYHLYRINVNSGATLATFYIDGASVCSVNSGLPSGTARATDTLPALVLKTAGTTQRNFTFDYFVYNADFTSAR